jgi:hypothetical protein
MPKRLSTEYMKMQVVYNLTGILAGVCNHPVAGFGYPCSLCDVLDSGEDMPKQCGLLSVQIICGGEVHFGNDQNVDGGLGLNVMERQDLFVLVDLAARDLTCGNFTENAVRGHGESLQVGN